ncbi:unnamed protein product [Ectocarpus sp. 12 AP-2014]
MTMLTHATTAPLGITSRNSRWLLSKDRKKTTLCLFGRLVIVVVITQAKRNATAADKITPGWFSPPPSLFCIQYMNTLHNKTKNTTTHTHTPQAASLSLPQHERKLSRERQKPQPPHGGGNTQKEVQDVVSLMSVRTALCV